MAQEENDTLSATAEIRPLTAEENAAAFGGPAALSNRFFITMGPQGMRLSFAEQSTNVPPIHRAAVLLAFQDAIELLDVMDRLLQPIRDAIKQAPDLPPHAVGHSHGE